MPYFFDTIAEWAWIIVPVSVAMFVGTLLLIPVVLIRLPANYFISQPRRGWQGGHPLNHYMIVIARNVLGIIMIGLGIGMLVLPGQGLLTILLGLILMDFPGKRRIEHRLIKYKPLRQSANWLRRRYNRPPFEFGIRDEKG